jgi:ketosteroid isomerase-like protein
MSMANDADPGTEPRLRAEALTDATEVTRALVTRLFAAYEQGDSRPLFDHVADDVRWTIAGTNPLSGDYRSKREFLAATYERLAAVLKEPVRPEVRRIVADADVAVVQWHGRATSVVDRPYDNDYCWIMRLDGDRIVEVTAYFDGGLVDELFRTTAR